MVSARILQSYRPDPSRWWIRQVPSGWPAASGVWTHLAERALGKARAGAVPQIDAARVSDLLYLPPVSPDNEVEATALAARLRSAEVPVVRQWRPAAPEAEAEDMVLDLLPTLLHGGARDLTALASECRSTGCRRAVWPLIPGLTASPAIWDAGLDRLAEAGLRVVVGQAVELSPGTRRELAEFTDAGGYQALFHGSPPDARAFARAAASRGLQTTPERPRLNAIPRLEFARRVATELTVIADLWLRLERPEVAGQNLLRAARWAEESEHDLRAVAREGNLAVLPWLDRHARQIVSDLAADRPSALRQALEAEYSGPE